MVGAACTANTDCPPAGKRCFGLLSSRCTDGICRIHEPEVGGVCTCYEGCDLETEDGRFLNCITTGEKSTCVAKACAPCGQPPAEGGCCAPGISNDNTDGVCYCSTGDGTDCSLDEKKCASLVDGVCCHGGPNAGKCCNDGTCGGVCGKLSGTQG